MENNVEAGHDDSQKVGLQFILAMPGLYEVAKVGDFGAKKYGQFNYKKGMKWMRLLGSCSRHLVSFIQGEDIDKESGISHIAHFVYDGLMLLDYIIHHRELDDRYGSIGNPYTYTKPTSAMPPLTLTAHQKAVLDHYGDECGPHCLVCL